MRSYNSCSPEHLLMLAGQGVNGRDGGTQRDAGAQNTAACQVCTASEEQYTPIQGLRSSHALLVGGCQRLQECHRQSKATYHTV